MNSLLHKAMKNDENEYKICIRKFVSPIMIQIKLLTKTKLLFLYVPKWKIIDMNMLLYVDFEKVNI